ncbi:hypothetical protein BDR04DRAFT_1162939 [Suillus decipiens]|nr:hypothetical protein BDR04DRAFT_1162939 [Suillus decipiens]
MQLEHPDEDLPAIQVSLSEFVSAAEQMFMPDQLDNFLRFVLAGRLQHHDNHARIFINARQGALAPPISEYQLYRDVDSVIGITRDLPFQLPMAIFPLASFRDSLTEDNHLKCPISCPKEVIGIPLHRIPNMALGKVDRRHVTRVFFPRLYCQGKNSAIPPETMTLIYEKCLRPTIVGLNPVDRSRWPITYSTAMTLYRDQKGQFHFGTVDFPSNLLDQLGRVLPRAMHRNSSCSGVRAGERCPDGEDGADARTSVSISQGGPSGEEFKGLVSGVVNSGANSDVHSSSLAACSQIRRYIDRLRKYGSYPNHILVPKCASMFDVLIAGLMVPNLDRSTARAPV